ncbi:MAG: sigma-70 family RNA polymerase sigma factor, partial [Planctomycetaceae bacterium]
VDPSRGFRFSTYATHAVRNHLLRVRRRRAVRTVQECCVSGSTADVADANCTDGEAGLELAEELDRLHAAMRALPERDRMMISARFGLGKYGQPNTFREMAALTGLSHERVRVLTQRALQRLRESMQKSAA